MERQCLLGRCTYQKSDNDYGFDGTITTYRKNGEIEPDEIKAQVKATSSIKFSKTHNCFVHDLSKRDLRLWLRSKFVVVIYVVYDAKTDTAYYIPLKEYFQEHRKSLKNVRKFVRIYLPPANIFNPAALKKIKKLKNNEYSKESSS